MLNRRTILIGVAALAVIVTGIIAATLMNRAPAPAAPTITPSATPALDQADTERLEEYSRTFVTSYLTYEHPSGPAYLNTIKPFLSDGLYAQIASESGQGGAAGAPAQQATVESVSVNAGGGEVTSSITARVTTAGTDPYTQTFRLTWQRHGDRWNISDLRLLESTRKFPYLES